MVVWKHKHDICKRYSQWEFAIRAGNPELVLCDHLVGWDGEADGRAVQEGEDICIATVDS